MVEVQFIDTAGDTPAEFAPRPAKQMTPNWWRELPSSWAEPENITEKRVSQTVKRCMPMLDMVSSGYILVTPSELHVYEKDGSRWYAWPEGELIQFHPPEQAAGHPATGDLPVPKWNQPWGIKTPAGYSCLFITPAHHGLPFRILEAVVDTDRYHRPVLFPFTLTAGFVGTIPAGTPMAQVIPFRRDRFSHKITTDQREQNRLYKLLFSSFTGGYRDNFWSRKHYD